MTDPNEDSSHPADEELVTILGDPKGASRQKRDALGTLYLRYSKGLFAHIRKVHGSFGFSDDEVTDLVTDTFIRFQNAAERFDPTVAKKPDEVPKLIRCWLAKHAAWAVLDSNEVASENVAAARITESELPASTPVTRSKQELANIRRIRKYLQTTPKKTQDVLRTSIKYFDDETETFRLPSDIQNSLMQRWGFSSPNALSQFRRREFAKLTKAILPSVA